MGAYIHHPKGWYFYAPTLYKNEFKIICDMYENAYNVKLNVTDKTDTSYTISGTLK